MTNIIHEDTVKLMERGQITIPLKIRETLNTYKGMRLKVRLTTERKMEIEAVDYQDKAKKLSVWLKKMAKDKRVYWTKEDDKRRVKINKLTQERLKRLRW